MATLNESELMLFNYETTYKTDFRKCELKPLTKTKYKVKPTCVMERPPPLKDGHTLTHWQRTIPFGLLHKPKEIVNTDPRNVQQAYSKQDIDPPSEERLLVQKTRPRIVMTPAVSMDEVDARTREILVRDFYTSDMTRGTREAVSEYFSVKAPLPGPMAPANPIALPRLKPPCVPPEWRMESVPWDSRQLRGDCDPKRRFWQTRIPGKCQGCDDFAAGIAHRRKLKQMKWK